MKFFNYQTQKGEFDSFLKNSKELDAKTLRLVEEIAQITKQEGDKALIDFSNKFDNANFEFARDFIASEEEISQAKENIDPKLFEALKNAYQRIFSYHQKQLPKDFIYDDEQGVKLGNLWRPIEKIGVYAPSGSACYPSSVLMCAVPALVAGVKEIVLCSPSQKGKVHDVLLAAAEICGIKRIYKIGGAQAISAMAYGTDSVARVDKIVGPGNKYVALAKKSVYGDVGIDMIAGPTDLTIIADENIAPEFVAADAISQLEHGPDSKVFVIVQNEKFADKILYQISELSKKLPRKEIIDQSLQNSAFIIVDDLNCAPEIVNKIAPEHLEIACDDAQKFVPQIQNAGAIFLGNYTPESIGDYIAGPSHTLPTEGTSRFASGLSAYDFLKRISLISCNKDSFNKLADDTEIMAQSEGLEGHKLSVSIRKNQK